MTIQELRDRVNNMPDAEFNEASQKIEGGPYSRDKLVRRFEDKEEMERRLCQVFGMPTEQEKITRSALETAEAAKRSSQAALESAEAAKTLARIAEEAYASSRRSAWKSTLSTIVSVIAIAVALGQYILSLSKS